MQHMTITIESQFDLLQNNVTVCCFCADLFPFRHLRDISNHIGVPKSSSVPHQHRNLLNRDNSSALDPQFRTISASRSTAKKKFRSAVHASMVLIAAKHPSRTVTSSTCALNQPVMASNSSTSAQTKKGSAKHEATSEATQRNPTFGGHHSSELQNGGLNQETASLEIEHHTDCNSEIEKIDKRKLKSSFFSRNKRKVSTNYVDKDSGTSKNEDQSSSPTRGALLEVSRIGTYYTILLSLLFFVLF